MFARFVLRSEGFPWHCPALNCPSPQKQALWSRWLLAHWAVLLPQDIHPHCCPHAGGPCLSCECCVNTACVSTKAAAIKKPLRCPLGAPLGTVWDRIFHTPRVLWPSHSTCPAVPPGIPALAQLTVNTPAARLKHLTVFIKRLCSKQAWKCRTSWCLHK